MRVLLSALLIFAGPALADPLAAVGRIERVKTMGSCTATLIAPAVVLTAAHCVRRHNPREFTFHVGDGRGLAPVAIKRFHLHPLYETMADRSDWRLRFDFALAELARPISSVRAIPLSTGEEARIGEILRLASWRRSDGDVPRQRDCQVIEGIEGLVTLDCPVEGGESGAPVLRKVPGGWDLVAVISSKGRQAGRPVSQASDIRLRLPPMLKALSDGS